MRTHFTLALAVLTHMAMFSSRSDADVSLRPLQTSVPQYAPVEFAVEVDAQYEHPFDPEAVELNILVRNPGGVELRVPAFWLQPYERREMSRSGRAVMWYYPSSLPQWRARFAPAEVGTYEAVAELTDRTGTRRSAAVTFSCTTAPARGFVRVSRRDPRFFEFSNGEPFFPIGQNLAFIGESQQVTPANMARICERLSSNGANYLRIWTCCHDWAMAVEARKSAWGRSWSWNPPFDTLPADEDSDRLYLKLDTSSRPALQISPTHSVALRPETAYVLSGRAWLEPAARLQVQVAGRDLSEAVAGGPQSRWQTFQLPFTTGDDEYWLGRAELQVSGRGGAWIDELSLREAAGGPELLWEAAVNRPERGYYNPLDCAILDDLVELARQQGIYLQLCLITRDAYMSDFKDADSPRYERAIADARKLLRYAVARWGYSTSVATWEYFNENDPGLPMERFHRELGEYLDKVDVYRHLRSTSTWHPSSRDCRSEDLDVASVHFYLRPVEDREYADEVDAAVENARWLREHAPAKPALIDEFGLADLKWGQTEEMRSSQEIADFHNGLWASALSGVSGTALAWWWDRLDPRNHYPHYRPLADFLADVPWTTAGLQPIQAELSVPELRLVGLQGKDRAYCWLFDPAASFESLVIHNRQPQPINGLQLTIAGLDQGTYCVAWWDTRTGRIVGQSNVALTGSRLQLTAPVWERDIACKVTREP